MVRRRRPWPLRRRALLLAWAFAGAIACKVQDRDYCLSSNDCRATWGSGGKTFCDIRGRFGPAHTCVPPQADAAPPVEDAPPDHALIVPEPAADASPEPAEAPPDGAAEPDGPAEPLP